MSQGPAGCPDHADEDGLAPRRCRCSDNDALRILGEFESLYKGRIAEVEADPRPTTDAQRTELKLKIMTDWVKDLGEQNAMLVQTVHDLEQAAVCRVKLLENKLQATSTLIAHNMSNTDKSEENLNVLSNRICHLASDQNDMQDKIDRLQSDIGNLLKLIKRGRTANNWDLDGITFYEVQPSDIQTPADCTCYQITNEIKNEESACDERDFKIKKLSEQLHNTEMKIEKLLHEQKCKESAHEMKSLETRRESECLRNKLACLEKESSESRHALSLEVAQKHDTIMSLRNEIKNLETQLCDSVQSLRYKDKVINQLREDLRKNSEKETKIKILENQVEELRMKLQTKDDMINEMKNYEKIKGDEVPNTKKKVRISEEHSKKKEIVHYLSNLKTSMEKDSEIIHNLKTEYETVLKSLKQTKNMHERDVSLANEKLLDIENCLSNYRTEVIEQDFSRDGVKEFIITIEKKIVFVEKLFQNNCKKCMEENVQSEIRDMISKVTLGIQKLSEIHENKHKITSSIRKIISENNKRCKKNSMNEEDQKAICAAISKQYRLMEEFRLCTVEVQAATEDLHEEVSEVISNLNSRHCKYIELNKMVCQVQDCLTKTREDMVEIIHHLELQDGERVRHSERITNNRIRLKDVKNEFNRTQTELSKCLNNVHNNIQQNNLLGYVEMNTCNDLLISVAEEVEQIVNDLQTFQTQGCCTLTTMNELKNQITVMELSVKDLKRKSENLLKENNVAEKCCEKNLKRLEKYECEVDNCHSKMQDVLESIVNVQDQMNEFGCIQESDDSHQSTNDTIKLKDELRRLHKECKELKQKGSQEDEINQKSLEWENKITDLQDQIHVLQNEIKCKQQLNIFLKQSIESLEKELISTRAKAEENRRCSSVESIDLKKKVIELENLLRVQKDVENSLKGLVINETHSKKSQHLDFVKDQHYGSPSKSILQGTNENISQLFKGLQDTIQTIKSDLQALTEKFKRLVPEGSPHPCDQNISEFLAKHIGSIDYCCFEMEKIKAAWYSKDKLMENMDEIIRIQKDSITISQSEVEDVHKTLQERIETQEKTIAQVEKEKRHLSKQIEFQVQTISHLQNAVVEAKRTLDQLTQKSATDVSEPWTPVSSTVFNHSNVHDV
ncbi:uncharacterized protein PFB0145c [Copidosoma floridanum]|uniref:uncharacterized protein PFB0145c n=1 Tax=Copidosoma floridanum TaxID=29053 RepID=UPI000C6FA73E|nr:uncharacterized protein PFB0145c [Copidosoma floridanum]